MQNIKKWYGIDNSLNKINNQGDNPYTPSHFSFEFATYFKRAAYLWKISLSLSPSGEGPRGHPETRSGNIGTPQGADCTQAMGHRCP